MCANGLLIYTATKDNGKLLLQIGDNTVLFTSSSDLKSFEYFDPFRVELVDVNGLELTANITSTRTNSSHQDMHIAMLVEPQTFVTLGVALQGAALFLCVCCKCISYMYVWQSSCCIGCVLYVQLNML